MKRQIRRGAFETNSSSTHSITMCMKKDFERWKSENLFLYNEEYGFKFRNLIKQPKYGNFYTKNEVDDFIEKIDEDVKRCDEDEYLDLLHKYGFYEYDYQDDCLEPYYAEYTTPSGEEVVAFGEYGYC